MCPQKRVNFSNANIPKFHVLTGVDIHFSRKRACVFNWLLKKLEFNAISQIIVNQEDLTTGASAFEGKAVVTTAQCKT